jgi:hypothetical protein
VFVIVGVQLLAHWLVFLILLSMVTDQVFLTEQEFVSESEANLKILEIGK